ncbi:hypothetical protein [Gracilimonas tropica]|uniref:hypothetical protein n=1 Tax=Gracilimonas tropica TaxID=454600 RepID=UPI0003707D18|nr:hypothetical protein [Gracilimonas tropica]
MNQYYTYMTIEGISSLLEVHYEYSGDTWINVYNWFDRQGDSPDLTNEQIQLIANDIRQFEHQRPLGVPAQENLRLQFEGLAA